MKISNEQFVKEIVTAGRKNVKLVDFVKSIHKKYGVSVAGVTSKYYNLHNKLEKEINTARTIGKNRLVKAKEKLTLAKREVKVESFAKMVTRVTGVSK